MILTELHLAIMTKNNCTQEEAEDIVMEMKERIKEGEDPEEILWEFGFEPDYVHDLL